MNKIGAYIFIIFIAGTVCYSLLKKRNVFQDFTDGVPSGLKTGLAIFPAITAMMLAVNMFTKSGLCDYFTKLITPVFTNIGIPAELIPLITLTPLSGSGSLSIFENLLKDFFRHRTVDRSGICKIYQFCQIFRCKRKIFRIHVVFF